MTAPPFAFLRRWALGASPQGVCVNRRGDCLALALGSGAVALMPADDAGEEPQLLSLEGSGVHLVASDADDHAFLASDEAGSLFLFEFGVPAPTFVLSGDGCEIVSLAASSQGVRAYASATSLFLLNPEGEPLGEPLALESAPIGLAFSPDGTALSFGVSKTLRVLVLTGGVFSQVEQKMEAPLQGLVWARESGVFYTLLANGKMLGWRLTKGALTLFTEAALPSNGEVGGPLSLSADGHYVVCPGLHCPACWAVEANGALSSRAPLRLGDAGERLVSALAPNPREPLVAIGYADGLVVLAPLDGRREIPLFPPVAPKGAKIVGLAWNKDGDCLHAALENGHVFLFTLKSVLRFVRGAVLSSGEAFHS